MTEEQAALAPAPSEAVSAAGPTPVPGAEPPATAPAPAPVVDPGLMGTEYRSLPDELIRTTERGDKLHSTERPERSG